MEIPSAAGDYVIAADMPAGCDLVIQSLGAKKLPAGIYLYCGSAHGPGGLKARIQRHLTSNARVFWHFDYLKPSIRILEAWWLADEGNHECEIAQFLVAMPDARTPVMGFGASDCGSHCPAHLIGLPMGSDLAQIFSRLKKQWPLFTRLPLRSD